MSSSVINTNLLSINAQRNLLKSSSMMSTAMERLSSGLRVNSAKDDAAGMSISTNMDAQIRGMKVAVRNANDGISLSQTAEGALGNMTESLQRMRELAVQAANGTYNTEDRAALTSEFSQLQEEITRVTENTKFNNVALFDGTATDFAFQVGAGTDTALDVVKVTTKDLTTGDLSKAADAAVLLDSSANALAAVKAIDLALKEVSSTRSTFGAAQSRLSAVTTNLASNIENTSAAKSRIVDADFAEESANLSRAQILAQAGTAMVAQAGQVPQQVLSLIR
jgi:flagellin